MLPVLSILTGCVLLVFPLVRSFHLDSAIIGGLAGGVMAVWFGSRKKSAYRNVLLILTAVYIAAIPLIIHDLIAGCFSTDGLAFWMFIPFFSIFFGYALGRAGRYLFPRKGRIISISIFFLFLAAGIAVPFFLFPQLYFFNHVFGYWPGAIYDESVTFPARLILFQIITLTWTGIFWMIPHLKGADHIIKGIFGLLLISLIINYVMMPRHGLISPESSIRASLGGYHQSQHFEFYYSKNDFNRQEIRFLANLHEFHFSELTDTLDVSWPEGKRISSYLYGDERQMQRNTGARGVSFVPVWQRSPQLHVRKAAVYHTLRHELVHVVAREFGNRMLNASWNIGLVEGLAVALAPASSTRLTPDQMVVANDAFFDKEQIINLFSFTGFYREPASVAYAVSGSFAATLIDKYPIEWFKKSYSASSLDYAYGDVLDDAVRTWHERLKPVSVTADEEKLAQAVFALPSIFDASCPRVYSRYEKHRDNWRFSMSERDTMSAILHLEHALRIERDWESGWNKWIRLKLEQRDSRDEASVFRSILEKREHMPEHPVIALRLADAKMLNGKKETADNMREAAILDEDLAPGIRKAWELRNSIDFWEKLVQILYMKHPDFNIFEDVTNTRESSYSEVKTTLILAFFSETFRRHPLPVEGNQTIMKTERNSEKNDKSREITEALIKKVFESEIDPHYSETYRNLIYLATELGIHPSFEDIIPAHEWRPVQQKRLEEAMRFYRYSTSYRSDESETPEDTEETSLPFLDGSSGS